MYNAIVAVLCGPHENGEISFRRIDVGIRLAIAFDLPLVIAGDGNFGQDVAAFQARAIEHGVTQTVVCYDKDANTLADVRMIAHLMTEPEFAEVRTIHLVTDYWHMVRAAIFLTVTLLQELSQREILIGYANVDTPIPPDGVLRAETRGVRNFLEGKYGTNGHAIQYGKPSHPSSTDFGYNSEVTLPSRVDQN